jgi:hypothetical protein
MSKNVDRDKSFKEAQRAYARGGHDHMFGAQQAATRRPGKTGKDDVRGPGEQFSTGGGRVPGKKSKVGIAAQALEGRTGNAAGSLPRTYGKPK